MANKDLFKQAIAEAKSVREAAIANAKEALEETLTPHLKDLLAAKLQEMEDSEKEEEINEVEVEEEIVAEGDGLAPVKEAEEAEDDSEESEDEAEEEEMPGHEAGESEEEEAAEEVEGDEDLSNLTVDQFKDMIRDIIAQEVGGGEPEAEIGADMDAGDIEGMGDEAPMEEPALDGGENEEEIDLDELIRELEVSVNGGEIEEMGDPGIADLAAILAGSGALVAGGFAIDKLMNALKSGKAGDLGKKLAAGLERAGAAAGKGIDKSVAEEEVAEVKHKEESNKMEEELAEALETIETLKVELNEVNILNSKLLYVNKIFKANNLTESQKVNIIAAFDKAETVKEVKLVFETVSENIVSVKKENVTESKVKGMASKATGTTASRPEVIAEVSDAVLRMQKLAGIIK